MTESPGFYKQVEGWLKKHIEKEASTLLMGLSGPQGCGKSTLSSALVASLSQQGYRAISVSIDDFYLPRSKQKKLSASTENPYLKQRGYPGTHDIELGRDVLKALKDGKPVAIPRFDKSLCSGQGDRLVKEEWEKIDTAQDVVILEGWMLGFKALQSVTVEYFKVINENLKKYEAWIEPLDIFFYLKPKEINYVIDWRIEAEQNMRQVGKDGMTDFEVKNYIEKFLPAYRMYASTVGDRRHDFKDYQEIELKKDRRP